ncbi:DegT/DnrJ/EryC1/StrS aminotransferase family protein, partial [Candidatus Woesebacteria bacterium]|nr:DegT/DnrJ/EryC1/StrS aminotransferase family protein [Candidatus Woesebacteria bacterium]
RKRFMALLKEKGVDTRTYFYPMHEQPVLAKYVESGTSYPISKHLSEVGLYLPSGLAITNKQIDYVIKAVKEVFS